MNEALDRRAGEVIGAAIEVHRAIGPGFGENVYEEALAIELGVRRIPFARQARTAVEYKGRVVGEGRVDFLIDGRLVIELKAVETLTRVHVAQVLAYLRALDAPLGLLMTFNVRLLHDGIKRVKAPSRMSEEGTEGAEEKWSQ